MNIKIGQAALSDNEEETLVIDQSKLRQSDNSKDTIKEEMKTMKEEIGQQRM